MSVAKPPSDVDVAAVEAPPVATPGRRLVELLRRLTFDQWDAIDAEYRLPAGPVDIKALGAFWLIAALLLGRSYVGNKVFFERFEPYTDTWRYPGIWTWLWFALICYFCYFVGPAIYIKLVLRERIRDFGFKLTGTAKHLPVYLGLFICVLPLVGLASTTEAFLKHYPFYKATGHSWTQLVMWEIPYALQFVTLEFFFRGFALFLLARYIGAYAVFAVAIPYAMIHVGKPALESFGAIITGTALGTLALRTRSIFGGILIHIGIAWSMDIMAMLQTGQLQRLLR